MTVDIWCAKTSKYLPDVCLPQPKGNEMADPTTLAPSAACIDSPSWKDLKFNHAVVGFKVFLVLVATIVGKF